MHRRNVRWSIAVLLCFSSALNYFDRQTLALLAGTLQQELGITPERYSYIVTAFLISYTIMYAISGRIVDRFGTRRSFAGFVSVWSVGDLLHAFARTTWEFASCRVLIGAAEPGNFPAALKAISEWFPLRERALAVGIFNSGTAIGACVAAPIVAWITLHYGWRYCFVAGAIFSALWAVAWLFTYRSPVESRRTAGAPVPPLRAILGVRQVWGCIGARILMDPISYFCAFWLPKFLQQDRGFDLKAIGRYFWIPYVASAAGNLLGGAVPRLLVGCGMGMNQARKMMMGVSAVSFLVCFTAVAMTNSPVATIAGLSVAMFSTQMFMFMALPAEALPETVVGAVTGLGGALGGVAGILSALIIGRVVRAGSFRPVLLTYAGFPLIAFVLVSLLIRRLGERCDIPAR